MEALRSCHDVPHHVQEAANSSDPTLESFFPSFLSLPFSSFLSLSLSLLTGGVLSQMAGNRGAKDLVAG